MTLPRQPGSGTQLTGNNPFQDALVSARASVRTIEEALGGVQARREADPRFRTDPSFRQAWIENRQRLEAQLAQRQASLFQVEQQFLQAERAGAQTEFSQVEQTPIVDGVGQPPGSGQVLTTQQQISSLLNRIPDQRSADRIIENMDLGILDEQQALRALQALVGPESTDFGPTGPSSARVTQEEDPFNFNVEPVGPLPGDGGGGFDLNNLLQQIAIFLNPAGGQTPNLDPGMVERIIGLFGGSEGGVSGPTPAGTPDSAELLSEPPLFGPPAPLGLPSSPPSSQFSQAIQSIIATGQFPPTTGLDQTQIILLGEFWAQMQSAEQLGIQNRFQRNRLALDALQNIQSNALQQGQLDLSREIAATNREIALGQLQHSQAQLAQLEAQMAQQGQQFDQNLQLERDRLAQEAQFFQQQLAFNEQQLAQQQEQFETANPFNVAARNILSGQGNLDNQFGRPLVDIGFQVPEGAAPGQAAQAGSFFGGIGLPNLGALTQLPEGSQRLLASTLGSTGTSQEDFLRQSANVTPSTVGLTTAQINRARPLNGRT